MPLLPWANHALDGLRDSWPSRCLRCGGGALRFLGWPLATTLIAWGALATEQGNDGLRVFLAGSLAHRLAGAALLTLWCFLAGYYARAAERYVCSEEQRSALPPWLRKQAPRLLPLLPALATAQVLWSLPQVQRQVEATLSNDAAAWIALALGLAMTLLMYARVRMINAWEHRLGGLFGGGGASLPQAIDARPTSFGTMAPLGVASLVAVNLLWVAAFVGSIFWPVTVGRALGPFPLLVSGSISILSLGFWSGLFSTRLRLPLLRILLVAVVLLHVLPFGQDIDSYDIRQVPDSSTAGRETLPDALDRWLTLPGERPTLVVVATAGGGIRAAQWTTTVLARLAREFPGFDRSLFAISGVSGGALGATFYVASLHPAAAACLSAAATADRSPAELRGTLLASVGAQDFLSPPLYRLLFSEVLSQAFDLDLPDRAAALEQGWERSWSTAWSRSNCPVAGELLAAPFLGLWRQAQDGGAWLPHLLLNGTSMGTGQRLVTTAIDLPAAKPQLIVSQGRTQTSLDPYDLFDSLCQDLPVSTAANNAARFPLVEPAGLLPLFESCGPGGKALPRDRIVDGGYFENFGADTARVLILRLAGLMRERKATPVNLLVVLITSDPAVGAILKDDSGQPLRAPPAAFTDLLGPAYAVYAARTAHGLEASYRLSETVANLHALVPGAFTRIALVEFNLEARGELAEPVHKAPLGWILTPLTADAIAAALEPGNITPANQRALNLARPLF
jgi:hypothetical protein